MRGRTARAIRVTILFGFALALAIPAYAFFHDRYLVFALMRAHSWFVGTDTPTDLLRAVWVTYVVLVIGSTVGRYRHAYRAASLLHPNARQAETRGTIH
jgi:hypothetical protein